MKNAKKKRLKILRVNEVQMLRKWKRMVPNILRRVVLSIDTRGTMT